MISRRRARGWLALALALGLLAGGCTVRVDDAPPAIPAPDAAERVRQSTAQDAEQLAELATSARADLVIESDWGEVDSDLDHIAADAIEHLQALGGVWTPPPRPDDPTTDAATTPAAATPAAATPADVYDELRSLTGAATTTATSDGVDGELATLLASIAINRSLQTEELR
ncbi:MAG: hypothetical protein JJE50_14785, partial [Actinomycetales bacterium]|nr:hypothetical protein [Actinomycetales bacterium]